MEDYITALKDEPMPRIELGTSSLPSNRILFVILLFFVYLHWIYRVKIVFTG